MRMRMMLPWGADWIREGGMFYGSIVTDRLIACLVHEKVDHGYFDAKWFLPNGPNLCSRYMPHYLTLHVKITQLMKKLKLLKLNI